MNTSHQLALIIAVVVGLFLYLQGLCWLISWWSGWRALAARFRNNSGLNVEFGGWQSARMRAGCHYNNALRMGADESGLYLSTIAIVPQHAPLLIPLSEIRFIERRKFFIWPFVEFRLGSLEQIPFTVAEPLAEKIAHSPGAPPSLIPHSG